MQLKKLQSKKVEPKAQKPVVTKKVATKQETRKQSSSGLKSDTEQVRPTDSNIDESNGKYIHFPKSKKYDQ